MLKNIVLILVVIAAMYITAKYPEQVIRTVEFGYVQIVGRVR